MSVNERLKHIIEYLKREKIIRSQQVFVEMMEDRSSVVSEYLSGKRKIGEKFTHKLSEAFPYISIQWLLSGEGEMISKVEQNTPTSNQKGQGVPYYDIDVTASLVESFSDIKEEPEFYVDFKPFNDCTAYLPVYGDSMYPMIASGEIVALKKVENPQYIQYGEPHLVITNAEANSMRTIKIIRKSHDKNMITLKPSNPNFDEMEIPRDAIVSLYIVKGKITRKQL